MPLFDENPEKKKKTHLRLLMRLAKADERSHPNEDRLILDVGKQMGMNFDEVRALRESNGNETLELPAEEEKRMAIFYHLLFLMGIDGEVSKEEMELCNRIGFRLGLNPNMTADMVRLMAIHVDGELPRDLLKQTVKKYLN